MTKFIMRVDDVGQAPEQHKPDVGLEFFKSWWNAGGWGEHPIYLGVVPAMLGPDELEWLLQLERSTKAVLCIHGWAHDKRTLEPDDIRRAREVLPLAQCVIPPYNMYDARTMAAMRSMLDPVLFGGHHEPNSRGREADHPHGRRPVLVNGVLHLSTEWTLYEHCYIMVERVYALKDRYSTHPLVVTAHPRWDVDFFGGVRELREALGDSLTTVEEARACASR